MDFVERCLNVSPDAGNGSVELLLIIVFFGILVLLGKRRGQDKRAATKAAG